MEAPLNALIVYAHPEERSFNAAMRRVAAETLAEHGHAVDISDLYRDGFDPVPRIAEFSGRADPDHFDLMREQAYANQFGTLAPDVAREQERVARADLILLQFPFWWWSMPAILKGWIDRVFSNGFAYGSRSLAGKSAMLCLTAETKERRFAADADYPILESIEGGILRYCGLTVLPRFVAAEMLSRSPDERSALLDAYRSHLTEQIG